MSRPSVASFCRLSCVAGVLASLAPLPGLAVDDVPPEALSVKVFPDRYVAAGKPFSDLAALEAWAKPTLSRFLWLDSCNPGSAGLLLAAVARFQPVYREGIQIRTFVADDPTCIGATGEAERSGVGVIRLPAHEEYQATDASGRSTLP